MASALAGLIMPRYVGARETQLPSISGSRRFKEALARGITPETYARDEQLKARQWAAAIHEQPNSTSSSGNISTAAF